MNHIVRRWIVRKSVVLKLVVISGNTKWHMIISFLARFWGTRRRAKQKWKTERERRSNGFDNGIKHHSLHQPLPCGNDACFVFGLCLAHNHNYRLRIWLGVRVHHLLCLCLGPNSCHYLPRLQLHSVSISVFTLSASAFFFFFDESLSFCFNYMMCSCFLCWIIDQDEMCLMLLSIYTHCTSVWGFFYNFTLGKCGCVKYVLCAKRTVEVTLSHARWTVESIRLTGIVGAIQVHVRTVTYTIWIVILQRNYMQSHK